MCLAVDPPFHLEATVRVLQRRPANLIDTWDERHYRRLIERFGTRLSDDRRTYFAFPSAADVADAGTAALKRCGMSTHKARALRAAAQAIASGTLTAAALERLPSPEALEQLVELPGIGPWSAALILLRGFGRADVFPQADTGAESSLISLMRLRSRAALA
ncbi:MAG: DNA-3-methyladenine glycosylase family protein, partial [Steroidobacteraceae bacterium]